MTKEPLLSGLHKSMYDFTVIFEKASTGIKMNFDKVSVEISSIHNYNHHLWSAKRINYHQGKIKTIKEIVVYHNENKRHRIFVNWNC